MFTNKNIAAFITTLLFFIWILPLGVFIKPSQEKAACNGQRAICLCTHLLAKQEAKNAGKAIYKSSGGAEQKEQNTAGSSHHFLIAQKKNDMNNEHSFYHQPQSFLYSFLAVCLIEYVPKI